jgi:hypothetical protein
MDGIRRGVSKKRGSGKAGGTRSVDDFIRVPQQAIIENARLRFTDLSVPNARGSLITTTGIS